MAELVESGEAAEAVETVEPEAAPGFDAMTIGRRAALVAAVGGVAALAVQAVGLARPDAVEARDGYALVAGQTITATRTSGVTTDNARTAFVGTSATGDGLAGVSNGPTKSGVYGVTAHAQGYGVFGRNKASAATGALGTPVDGVQGTVRGANAAGVRGMAELASSAAVVGENHGKRVIGALGHAEAAVYALVEGEAEGNTADALSVKGPVRFSRSGIITIHAGERSGWQAVSNIPPDTCVFAMSQMPELDVGVSGALANVVEGRVYVYLTAAVASSDVAVAWWLLQV
jgi:hypothetical protein